MEYFIRGYEYLRVVFTNEQAAGTEEEEEAVEGEERERESEREKKGSALYPGIRLG